MWVVGLVLGVGWVTLLSVLGNLACPHETSDSNYGTLRWSLIPPGSKCVWTEERNGLEDEDGPGLTGTAYVSAMAVGAALVVVLRKAAYPPTQP